MKLVPVLRIALDGKAWWVIYDSDLHKYTTCTVLGANGYRTLRKKDCIAFIKEVMAELKRAVTLLNSK